MSRIEHNKVWVSLNDVELERLYDYAHVKEMSTSGVMRQAFRLYDIIEKHPELLEHIQRFMQQKIGPKVDPSTDSYCRLEDVKRNSWQPIETAPRDGRWFLAYVPIERHRLVMCIYSKQGILLNESFQPLPWPATNWHPLPERPDDCNPTADVGGGER